MNKYGLKIMTTLLLAGGLAVGCIRDEDGMPCNNSNEGVNLIISVAGMDNKNLTRAASERTDRSRIEDMNIVLADAGGVIREIIYVPNNAKPTNPEMGDNGLIDGSLPADNGTLTYHVGSKSWSGKSQIFIVCNYWQVDANGSIIENNKDLNNCLKINESTVDDLKALKQGTPWISGIITSALFGKAMPSTGAEDHGGQNYTCTLERTTAMVTVAIENKGLKDGVKITPRSFCLHNVPEVCNIGKSNIVGSDEVTVHKDGLNQSVGWEALTSGNTGLVVGGHGADQSVTPVFLFENLQGIMNQANEDEINKSPIKGKENDCSYIEVIADYLYVPTASGESQKYISGPIKYRLYLGENITNNFNVHRNKHYQVTLSLKGMGGLVEDGRTDENGNYLGDGEGASWRVESIGVTGGGSFLTEGVNMSSNGFLSYVGFVGEPDKEYYVYDPNSNWMSWLWAETEGGWASPGEEQPAKIFKGEDGISYVKIYAQPWLDDPNGTGDTWEKTGGKTLQSWIENGKRTMNLVLKEKGTGKIVSEFEVRQWLPMPVMVDDNNNPITTGNPNDASFYYSRIDVYEGREIPWGPVYFNEWNVTNLNANNIQFYNGDPYTGGKPRSYNSQYGFDNTMALYGTKSDAFTFQSDNGVPGSAMSVAVFRAGNARQQGQTSPSYSFNEMAHIGVPTIEEWEKIMQYGVVDVRFGISNVPYWTSSMEGTQTYTYNPVIGTQTLENRANKHRVRLVYHKNDFATKK